MAKSAFIGSVAFGIAGSRRYPFDRPFFQVGQYLVADVGAAVIAQDTDGDSPALTMGFKNIMKIIGDQDLLDGLGRKVDACFANLDPEGFEAGPSPWYPLACSTMRRTTSTVTLAALPRFSGRISGFNCSSKPRSQAARVLGGTTSTQAI